MPVGERQKREAEVVEEERLDTLLELPDALGGREKRARVADEGVLRSLGDFRGDVKGSVSRRTGKREDRRDIGLLFLVRRVLQRCKER